MSSNKAIAICFCLLISTSGILVEAFGMFKGGHGHGHGDIGTLLAAGLITLLLKEGGRSSARHGGYSLGHVYGHGAPLGRIGHGLILGHPGHGLALGHPGHGLALGRTGHGIVLEGIGHDLEGFGHGIPIGRAGNGIVFDSIGHEEAISGLKTITTQRSPMLEIPEDNESSYLPIEEGVVLDSDDLHHAHL